MAVVPLSFLSRIVTTSVSRPLLAALLSVLLVAGACERAWAQATRPGVQRPKPLLPPKPPALPRDSLKASVRKRASPIVLPLAQGPPTALRQPRAARLRALREQRAFQYVEIEENRESPSVWSLFWSKLWEWLGGLFSGPTYETKGRYVIYGLFGAALLYVVLRLLKLDLTTVLGRRARTLPLPYEAMPENIHAVDFGRALADAEVAGNYRLAVRLGYLLVLRRLTEQGLIQWQPDKTNYEYVREVAGTRWAADFTVLTRQFEYVWYGEVALTATAYPALRETREHFLSLLTRAAA